MSVVILVMEVIFWKSPKMFYSLFNLVFDVLMKCHKMCILYLPPASALTGGAFGKGSEPLIKLDKCHPIFVVTDTCMH